MPLSERELRLLEEIEQGLSTEDPGFVAKVSSARPGRHARAVGVLCGVGVVVGLAVVITGLTGGGGWGTAVGVLGFILIVGSCLGGVIAARGRRKNRLRSIPSDPGRSRNAKAEGLRTRMARRLHRRFDEN